MNERIRELMNQTGFTQQDLAHGRDQMLTEFARLIVQECAAYAFSDDQDHKAMLNHFGVKE